MKGQYYKRDNFMREAGSRLICRTMKKHSLIPQLVILVETARYMKDNGLHYHCNAMQMKFSVFSFYILLVHFTSTFCSNVLLPHFTSTFQFYILLPHFTSIFYFYILLLFTLFTFLTFYKLSLVELLLFIISCHIPQKIKYNFVCGIFVTV